MQILDWIFRGYWFSVTILSSVLLHSTMLRAYWMLEIIYGTVRPAQLECFILGTRVETKLVKCRLEHSLKCHGLHFRSRASMVLNWGGGGGQKHPHPAPMPFGVWVIEWPAYSKQFHHFFLLTFWQRDRNESNWKIEKLTQMTSPQVLKEDINLLTFLLIIDIFLRSKQYLKSVLKQTYWDCYDMIWSRMIVFSYYWLWSPRNAVL